MQIFLRSKASLFKKSKKCFVKMLKHWEKSGRAPSLLATKSGCLFLVLRVGMNCEWTDRAVKQICIVNIQLKYCIPVIKFYVRNTYKRTLMYFSTSALKLVWLVVHVFFFIAKVNYTQTTEVTSVIKAFFLRLYIQIKYALPSSGVFPI